MKRLAGGLAAFVLAFPSVSSAQAPAAGGAGVGIEHKAVNCIVAGKFPKLNACFAPSSSVARARVYFRAEGGTTWYYVDMKSDAPCMAGILPKPRKEMIDKHVDYYVHATDKSFTEARTLEYNPLVVASEDACKDKLMAVALPKASVAVFPSLPAGFAAGGLGAGVVIGGGVVAAGAAGGIYAATKNDNSTPSSTSGSATTTTTPTSGGTTTTTTSTTTTTTPTSPAFRFSFQASPLKGTEPLEVTLDMCNSTPETSLRYFYDFDGDGIDDFQGPFCSQTRTFNYDNVDVFPAGRVLPSPSQPTKTWNPRGCAEPRNENVQPQERRCQTTPIKITKKASPSPSPINSAEGANPEERHLAWSSQLEVAGASGQVVLNGSSTVFSGAGRSNAVAEGRRGTNRIEAQLVEGSSKAGTWRFEFGGTTDIKAGSLRVVAGDVVAVAGNAVTFRLRGTPGERVVFTFDTAR